MTTHNVFTVPEFSGDPTTYSTWRRKLGFLIPFAIEELREKKDVNAGKRLGLAIMSSVREEAGMDLVGREGRREGQDTR
jgi:hypothetical protein